MKSRKKITALLLSAIIGASLSLATVSAFAKEKGNSKNIAVLTTDWYQWQETSFPNFDFGEGPVYCDTGQRGKVWHLGGSGGGAPVVRECMDPIPRGKRLFFPLVNVAWFNDLSADPPEDLTVAEKRELISGVLSDLETGFIGTEACKLDVTVDGEPVIFTGTAIQRVQSPSFDYGGDPETVSDGFWVLLPKLSSGEHTIRFGGSFCEFGTGDSIGFDVDVTYVLTIAGKHKHHHDD